jgi:hypothetical protein
MKRTAFTLQKERLSIEASALPAPLLSYDTERKQWRLEQDYSYRDGPTSISVEKGFLFDLASIPRPLWWLLANFELSISAPLVHDFLYRNGGAPPAGIDPRRTYTRAETDALFRRMMELEGVSAVRRTAAYIAVRLLGGLAWRSV